MRLNTRLELMKNWPDREVALQVLERLLDCEGSQATPGPTGARNNAPADFAFRQVNNVGTRIDNGLSR